MKVGAHFVSYGKPLISGWEFIKWRGREEFKIPRIDIDAMMWRPHGLKRRKGHCYYCHLENMSLKTRIWRWLVG